MAKGNRSADGKLAARLRLTPGRNVSLGDLDAGDVHGWEKDTAQKELDRNIARMFDLQYVMHAQGKHSVLVILQAMDAGGKDGCVRSTMRGLNPQGVRVTSFKAPNSVELSHDFLWRVHRVAPAAGEIGIFNRSHYEDVLIARVRKLVPKSVWTQRYQQINDFERILAENNTVVLKIFLHISKDEQKQRLENRLKDPTKHWKARPEDFTERVYWDAYMEAYEDVFQRTGVDAAPWYVVPANRKWFRNLAVSEIIVDALKSLKLRLPRSTFDLSSAVIE
ncbi:MAG: polyphosphate kinase 2 family protein [Bryobacteraceae bacterium]